MSNLPGKLIPFLLSGALALPSGCRRADKQPSPPTGSAEVAWFEDATEKLGIDFRHEVGPTGTYFMPESVGSGAGLLDYDNNGLLDLYLLQNAGVDSGVTNVLLRQQSDGRFTDVSEGSGLDVAGRGMGVAIGDVTNDGWPDVLVTEFARVRLFLNNGNGTFREMAVAESGLDNPFWGTSACFFDYDRDGWLDLVVANYVAYDVTRPCVDESGRPEYCGPKAFTPGTVSKLFRNLGAESTPGLFSDATVASGLGALPGPALGVVCADFNGDHWPDIFIANDMQANRLWMNQRDGSFKDEALTRGVAFNAMGQAQGNMGIALGDVNNDNEFDLFVTHLNDQKHLLWTQSPRGIFQDVTGPSGMASPKWHGTAFGTVFGDFNNDQLLDAALVNGDVRRKKTGVPSAETVKEVGAFWAAYAERNQLFVNDGRGRFHDASAENPPFCGSSRVARGLACGDLDNDGGLDLLVTNIAANARIYRNVAPKRGHWLIVRVIDPHLGGRDAHGAVITIATASGPSTRWCNPAYSYLTSNDHRVHFGLGAEESIREADVLWPDGVVETFSGHGVDQVIVLRKGEGVVKGP